MKKLYFVTVEVEYVAVAESEAEAQELADDVVRDESWLADCASAREMKGPCLPAAWDEDSLVYGEDNLTVAAAWEKYGGK